MLKTGLNNRNAWLGSMAALVIVIGCLAGIEIGRNGVAGVFTGGNTYRQIAQHFADTGRYSVDGTHPTGYRPPGYPLLLAGIRWIWGSRAQLGGLISNLALDVACLALLLVLVDRLSRSPRVMLLAGLVFATDVAFHLEAMAQRETMLYTFLLLAFFVAATGRDVSYGSLLLMTAAAALAWLTRPTGIALIPLLLIAACFQTPQKGVGLRVARVVSACCVLTAIVLPWQVFLYRSFGEPVPAGTTSSGLNLYQGNNPAADVLIPYVDIDKYLPTIDARLREMGFAEHDELARSRWLKADAIEYIKEKPAAFVRRAAIKVLALYSPMPTPLGTGRIEATANGVSLKDYRYQHSVWTIAIALHGVVLLCLVGYAIAKWRRVLARRPRTVMLILGYLLLVTALHAITFAETRFRLPLDPLLIALSATAVFQSANADAKRPKVRA